MSRRPVRPRARPTPEIADYREVQKRRRNIEALHVARASRRSRQWWVKKLRGEEAPTEIDEESESPELTRHDGDSTSTAVDDDSSAGARAKDPSGSQPRRGSRRSATVGASRGLGDVCGCPSHSQSAASGAASSHGAACGCARAVGAAAAPRGPVGAGSVVVDIVPSFSSGSSGDHGGDSSDHTDGVGEGAEGHGHAAAEPCS